MYITTVIVVGVPPGAPTGCLRAPGIRQKTYNMTAIPESIEFIKEIAAYECGTGKNTIKLLLKTMNEPIISPDRTPKISAGKALWLCYRLVYPLRPDRAYTPIEGGGGNGWKTKKKG